MEVDVRVVKELNRNEADGGGGGPGNSGNPGTELTGGGGAGNESSNAGGNGGCGVIIMRIPASNAPVVNVPGVLHQRLQEMDTNISFLWSINYQLPCKCQSWLILTLCKSDIY